MKLTFVISGLSEQSITALPWKYVFELAKSLAKKGHNVQIITDEPMCQIGVNGITVSRVLRIRQWSAFSLGMNPRQVDEMIENFSSDLVCVFSDSLGGYFVRRLRSKVPLIVNVSKGIYALRQLDFTAHFSPYFYFSNSPFARFIVRLLNHRKIVAVTVPTWTIKRSLEECGVESNRIVVLPMAFGKAAYQNENTDFDMIGIREKLGLSKGDFIVTYFGPPYARRGVNDLVHAAAVLRQKFPVRLLLLLRQDERQGSRELDSIRKLSAELGVADRVTLVASVLPKNRLVSYLEVSDVVALPFRYVDEEPPLGLLEAMALGKPVITTNINSLPDIVCDNRGILVRPGNIDDLAKAIRYLFKHPENAERMAAEGGRYAKTLKDWDELADSFLCLAEQLSSKS